MPGLFQHVSTFLFLIKQYLWLVVYLILLFYFVIVIALLKPKICVVLNALIWCSTTVFSHSQTVVVCGNCQTVLCQPTGGRARLTEGCSFRKKGDWGVSGLFRGLPVHHFHIRIELARISFWIEMRQSLVFFLSIYLLWRQCYNPYLVLWRIWEFPWSLLFLIRRHVRHLC